MCRVLSLTTSGSEKLVSQLFLEFRHAIFMRTKSTRCASSWIPGSKSHFTIDRHANKHIMDIQRLVGTLSALHATGLVVSHKRIEEKIVTPKGWDICHFGDLRGHDEWNEKECVVVVGRMQPSPQQVQRQAKALFYDSETKLEYIADNDNYPERPCGYWIKTGEEYGVRIPFHPDPYCQAILEQVREHETIQAVDRIRSVNSKKTKTAYILCEIPVDLTVDTLVEWSVFSSRLMQALIRNNGILPLSPEWLCAHHSEFWETPNSAEIYIRRMDINRLNAIYSILGSDGLNQLSVYTYRIQRQRRPTRCLSLYDSSSTKRKLAHLVGPLKAFNISP